MLDIANIQKGVSEGNFLLLAKAISFIENKEEGSNILLQQLQPQLVPVIGFTGPPGAGKSTLVSAMIEQWVVAGKKVAVLSVDPSSPFHKGAILGDRIRMKEWYTHPQVFIRSLATRGHLGGLMSGIIELSTLLQSVGFDIVLIETVGVGQSEIEIAHLADTTVVVLVPEAGDEVQMMKSGLMEIADIFVVNKSDRPDAASFANHIKQMVMESHTTDHLPPVIATIATQNIGIQELANAVMEKISLPISLPQKKQMLIRKMYQLIAAEKMRQIDATEMEAQLDIVFAQPHFNIFDFAKRYYK
jgi:LAO/AO transport system kinase